MAATQSIVCQAYRPFDSTDADVAGPGEFELELGPVGYLREPGERSLLAPAVVANFGLPGERELVFETTHRRLLEGTSGEPRSQLQDSSISVKQMLRTGSLQEGTGPSLGAEAALLLPDSRGDSQPGAAIEALLSQRWPDLTLHLNTGVAWDRDHHGAQNAGMIVEGPAAWTLRPAVELLAEHSVESHAQSVLLGAIWRVDDSLSGDFGWRSGRINGEPLEEFRIGLTWSTRYWRFQ